MVRRERPPDWDPEEHHEHDREQRRRTWRLNYEMASRSDSTPSTIAGGMSTTGRDAIGASR
jgi:hypothetical protein